MVLKVLIFTIFYFGGVVIIKELIFTIFYFGGVVIIKELIFNIFFFGDVVIIKNSFLTFSTLGWCGGLEGIDFYQGFYFVKVWWS